MTTHQLLDALEDKPRYRDELNAEHGELMNACRYGFITRFKAGGDCYQITDAGRRELAQLRSEIPNGPDQRPEGSVVCP